MIISVEINNQTYRIDSNESIDISIPLDFAGAQPNAFNVEPATAKACEIGNLIGDTRLGGSCNFEEYKFITHCNGTHTESVGHITRKRIFLLDCLKDNFFPSTLISVAPENAVSTADTYPVDLTENDSMITRKAIENGLENVETDWLDGLIVRTLPNDSGKKTRHYAENSPPFFSLEAMRFIKSKGVKHLLVDLPSLDRTDDDGHLAAHRIFWNVAPGSFEIDGTSRAGDTITEMIFAPDAAADGGYLVNLQIAPFVADAAPSRPILFKMFK